MAGECDRPKREALLQKEVQKVTKEKGIKEKEKAKMEMPQKVYHRSNNSHKVNHLKQLPLKEKNFVNNKVIQKNLRSNQKSRSATGRICKDGRQSSEGKAEPQYSITA